MEQNETYDINLINPHIVSIVSDNENFNHYDFLKKNGGYEIFVREKDRLINDIGNKHHMLISWHYNKLMPLIAMVLNINYKQDDFDLVENITEIGDYSYFFPKIDKLFTAQSFLFHWNDEERIHYTWWDYNFPQFSYREMVNCDVFNDDFISVNKEISKSYYHRLFFWAHQCCKIENLGENNGKTLLISGDSHMIPIVPILCYYYKKVIVLDNRYPSVNAYEILTENETIDDTLLLIWNGRPLNYYIKENFV